MTPDEFREAGHRIVDWIADYRTALPEGPVLAQVDPGAVVAGLASTAPTETVEVDQLLRLVEDVVVPGVTQVQHPMHFGWFPSNASLSSVLGDLVSSGLGSLGLSWESSPALTEVEQVVCDWMRQLTGLSPRWSGTIQDTASTACLVALLCARERATDHSQAGVGLAGVDRPPVVYSTDQAHSSVRKAALLAGYGADNLRVVAAHPHERSMDPDDLGRLMAADRAEGRVPAAVVATVGSTATTAFDPIEAVVAVAAEHGAWVHVDAAMAGTAMLVPECRGLWAGVEGADSLCWNPHKWMGAVLDTSLYYVTDPQHLIRVMSTNPSYLRSDHDGEVVQYRDWGIPLGRRFRSLKLLFQLELDGVASIQQRIRRDLANAAMLAEWAEAEPGWEVVAPVRLQTVCLRHRPSVEGRVLDGPDLDRHTLDWVGSINRSGRAYLTPSMLDGRWMVRVSIGVEGTEASHVETLWALLRSAAAESSAALATGTGPVAEVHS